MQRSRTAIINAAFKDALSKIVYRLAGEPDANTPEHDWVDGVSHDWFSKPKARREVLNLLEKYHLDESAIGAVAIRSRFSELEKFDRVLVALGLRLDKVLRAI